MVPYGHPARQTSAVLCVIREAFMTVPGGCSGRDPQDVLREGLGGRRTASVRLEADIQEVLILEFGVLPLQYLPGMALFST